MNLGDTCSNSSGVNHVIYVSQKNHKYKICRYQVCSFKLKMHQNPFSAGAPPQTPLGELTTLPQTPKSTPSPPHSPPLSTPSATRSRRLVPRFLAPHFLVKFTPLNPTVFDASFQRTRANIRSSAQALYRLKLYRPCRIYAPLTVCV